MANKHAVTRAGTRHPKPPTRTHISTVRIRHRTGVRRTGVRPGFRGSILANTTSKGTPFFGSVTGNVDLKGGRPVTVDKIRESWYNTAMTSQPALPTFTPAAPSPGQAQNAAQSALFAVLDPFAGDLNFLTGTWKQPSTEAPVDWLEVLP